MMHREEIIPTEYEDIPDELLRGDLKGLADKLKREVLDNPIRPRMPIGEFQRKWLAMFIGQRGEESTAPGIPVARWYTEVTTNPYTWVDIVLPTGEIAYSVPPLLNSDAVNVNHVDFYHHIMELQAMSDHGATKGELEKYREQHILKFIGADANADTYINEINKMAMFHGYAPFTETNGVSKEGKVTELSESKGFGEAVRVDDF